MLEKTETGSRKKKVAEVSSGREECKWYLTAIVSVFWMECAQNKVMVCLK